MIIVLDPGHGAGKNSNRGSLIGNEGDNNWAYAQVLKAELELYKNVTVKLTRTATSDPSLTARGAVGAGADLLISLHSNAFSDSSVRGVEVWDSVSKPNLSLASTLSEAIAKAMGTSNRGVKHKRLADGRDWYGILRDSKAKGAMMIEHGFHTNKEDVKAYTGKRGPLAQATAQVIAKQYGLTLKPVTPPTTGKLYRVQVGAYSVKTNAEKLAKELQAKGYDTYITHS